MEPFIWLGILACVIQSGIFSGLNLAVFGISSLQLRALTSSGNQSAAQLLHLRKDSNFLLATILWGNVSVNVLLTLLSDSVLAGLTGFVFSTFVITFGGEILPQAYFSRHALRMASLLRPILRLWQVILFPVAKPTGLLLDYWLGKEGVTYLREHELKEAIKHYTADSSSEISRVEGIGILNFLSIDDLHVTQEGGVIDPISIIEVEEVDGHPRFPVFESTPDDPFLKQVEASGQSWVFITTPGKEPSYALDADGFLRAAFFSHKTVNILEYCHRPIIVHDEDTKLGDVIPRLIVEREHPQDDVIDHDLIVLWGREKRVITGADLLGRLMRGISKPQPAK